jgi:hypothetical protein
MEAWQLGTFLNEYIIIPYITIKVHSAFSVLWLSYVDNL